MAKKSSCYLDALLIEAVLGLTFGRRYRYRRSSKKSLNESDPADPNGALVQSREEMTREGKVDFQNMANVSLKDFKVTSNLGAESAFPVFLLVCQIWNA